MVLKTQNLCKTIGHKKILDNVNIEIPPKTIVGFIGPNGAGKTTTMKLCCGVASITSGDIFLNDLSIKTNYEQYMKHIGVSLSNNNFYNNMSAFDNMKIFSSLLSVTNKQIENALNMVGLANRKDSLVGTYSLGMKQRLSLALSILHNPSIILLDEPFNGIDPKGIFELRSIIKEICQENGASFLISSHNLSEIAKITTENYYINRGIIVKHDMIPSNQSQIDIKVDKPNLLLPILSTLKIQFSREGNTFFFSINNEDINLFFQRIITNDISILEFASGSYLEHRYIEMMGDHNID